MSDIPQLYKDPHVVQYVESKNSFEQPTSARCFDSGGVDVKNCIETPLGYSATFAHGTILLDVTLKNRVPGKDYILFSGMGEDKSVTGKTFAIQLESTDGNRVDKFHGHWDTIPILIDAQFPLPIENDGRLRMAIKLGPTQADTKVVLADESFDLFYFTGSDPFPTVGGIRYLGYGNDEDTLQGSSDVLVHNFVVYDDVLSDSEIYAFLNKGTYPETIFPVAEEYLPDDWIVSGFQKYTYRCSAVNQGTSLLVTSDATPTGNGYLRTNSSGNWSCESTGTYTLITKVSSATEAVINLLVYPSDSPTESFSLSPTTLSSTAQTLAIEFEAEAGRNYIIRWDISAGSHVIEIHEVQIFSSRELKRTAGVAPRTKFADRYDPDDLKSVYTPPTIDDLESTNCLRTENVEWDGSISSYVSIEGGVAIDPPDEVYWLNTPSEEIIPCVESGTYLLMFTAWGKSGRTRVGLKTDVWEVSFDWFDTIAETPTTFSRSVELSAGDECKVYLSSADTVDTVYFTNIRLIPKDAWDQWNLAQFDPPTAADEIPSNLYATNVPHDWTSLSTYGLSISRLAGLVKMVSTTDGPIYPEDDLADVFVPEHSGWYIVTLWAKVEIGAEAKIRVYDYTALTFRSGGTYTPGTGEWTCLSESVYLYEGTHVRLDCFLTGEGRTAYVREFNIFPSPVQLLGTAEYQQTPSTDYLAHYHTSIPGLLPPTFDGTYYSMPIENYDLLTAWGATDLRDVWFQDETTPIGLSSLEAWGSWRNAALCAKRKLEMGVIGLVSATESGDYGWNLCNTAGQTVPTVITSRVIFQLPDTLDETTNTWVSVVDTTYNGGLWPYHLMIRYYPTTKKLTLYTPNAETNVYQISNGYAYTARYLDVSISIDYSSGAYEIWCNGYLKKQGVFTSLELGDWGKTAMFAYIGSSNKTSPITGGHVLYWKTPWFEYDFREIEAGATVVPDLSGQGNDGAVSSKYLTVEPVATVPNVLIGTHNNPRSMMVELDGISKYGRCDYPITPTTKVWMRMRFTHLDNGEVVNGTMHRDPSANRFYFAITADDKWKVGYGDKQLVGGYYADTEEHEILLSSGDLYVDNVLVASAPEGETFTETTLNAFCIGGIYLSDTAVDGPCPMEVYEVMFDDEVYFDLNERSGSISTSRCGNYRITWNNFDDTEWKTTDGTDSALRGSQIAALATSAESGVELPHVATQETSVHAKMFFVNVVENAALFGAGGWATPRNNFFAYSNTGNTLRTDYGQTGLNYRSHIMREIENGEILDITMSKLGTSVTGFTPVGPYEAGEFSTNGTFHIFDIPGAATLQTDTGLLSLDVSFETASYKLLPDLAGRLVDLNTSPYAWAATTSDSGYGVIEVPGTLINKGKLRFRIEHDVIGSGSMFTTCVGWNTAHPGISVLAEGTSKLHFRLTGSDGTKKLSLPESDCVNIANGQEVVWEWDTVSPTYRFSRVTTGDTCSEIEIPMSITFVPNSGTMHVFSDEWSYRPVESATAHLIEIESPDFTELFQLNDGPDADISKSDSGNAELMWLNSDAQLAAPVWSRPCVHRPANGSDLGVMQIPVSYAPEYLLRLHDSTTVVMGPTLLGSNWELELDWVNHMAPHAATGHPILSITTVSTHHVRVMYDTDYTGYVACRTDRSPYFKIPFGGKYPPPGTRHVLKWTCVDDTIEVAVDGEVLGSITHESISTIGEYPWDSLFSMPVNTPDAEIHSVKINGVKYVYDGSSTTEILSEDGTSALTLNNVVEDDRIVGRYLLDEDTTSTTDVNGQPIHEEWVRKREVFRGINSRLK